MRDDISLDETMFVIGSGPCLNKIDIKLLKGLNTISLNRQFIAYDDWGFWPKYYVCIDWRLIKTIYENQIIPLMMDPKCEIENFFILADKLSQAPHVEISKSGTVDTKLVTPEKLIKIPTGQGTLMEKDMMDKFIGCVSDLEMSTIRSLGTLFPDGDLSYDNIVSMAKEVPDPKAFKGAIDNLRNAGVLMKVNLNMEKFHTAVDTWAFGKYWPTANLGYRSLSGTFSVSLAHTLGYKRVVLLGVDANYVERSKSIEAGKDLNHFHPNYFDVEEYRYGRHYGTSKGAGIEAWEFMAIGDKSEHPHPYDDNKHALGLDETFEIISCSPGSIINTLFEYVDLEELLKTYEVNNEN